jgi:hypothetical protein
LIISGVSEKCQKKINKMKNLKKMFINKEVNPKYYETIKITGEKEPIGLIEGIRQYEANKPPVRIEEEFKRMDEVSRKPKVMTIYGGFEFIKKLRKMLPKIF